MANTYTQITIQAVFTPFGRCALIPYHIKGDLCKYITGIVSAKKQKMLAINCLPDHLHRLVGMDPDLSVSTLLQHVKAASSRWINRERLLPVKFSWQKGFGAFSYSKSQRQRVIKYIEYQETHHREKSFKEEYLNMLLRSEVPFDTKFMFEFYDDVRSWDTAPGMTKTTTEILVIRPLSESVEHQSD